MSQGYFKSDLRIGPDGDVPKTHFNQALKIARGIASDRGFAVPVPETIEKLDRVQMFAVAVLHPKFQFAEELVRALLALELDDKMGILVATCSFVQGEDRFIHRLLLWQPWVSENAEFLIATVLNSAQMHVDDGEVFRSGRPLRAGRQGQARAALAINREIFLANHNRHHYEAASICNGVGGALIVSQLVEQEARIAKYDNWLPDPSTIQIADN
jgi:hypothetical protein